MPGKDGTGPLGQDPLSGKGSNRKRPRGITGLGSTGYCICPKCGEKVIHTAGIPCTSVTCSKCGAIMTRAF